jgi:hypothetical protein
MEAKYNSLIQKIKYCIFPSFCSSSMYIKVTIEGLKEITKLL